MQPNYTHPSYSNHQSQAAVHPEVVEPGEGFNMPVGTNPIGLGDISNLFSQLEALFNTGPATADTPITTTSPIGPIGAMFNGIMAFVQQNPMVALLGGGLLVVLVVANQSGMSGTGRRNRKS